MLPVVETRSPEEQTAVRQALQSVLSSVGFSRNDRQSQFLRFLVERHLEGRDAELKESVIAVEVFGRDAGYDPKLDAIVRTEAIRLRSRLNKYYETAGSRDPLIIELPKGGYRPVVREREIAPVAMTARPARRWWVAGALGTVAVALAVTGMTSWRGRPPAEPYTVAVLPLENLSPDSASDYFTDGLTDEIIRSLSIINGLTVRSRTSSFALKGKRLKAAAAATQLGADYLVEGSVLYAGEQLRVNAQLVRARDDVPLWSGRFDRRLTDVFTIQDEISRGIVNGLRLKLRTGPRQYETNLEAYVLYLRGRQAMESFPARGRPTAMAGVRFFEQAIQKDSSYAIAYAGIADALVAIDENIGAAARPDIWPRAKAAAKRAVELDPMLSEAQSAQASIRAREFAWQEAEEGFRRALEINPNNAPAHLQLGFLLIFARERFDEGLAEVRRAMALDPLSPHVTTELGHALMLAGRYDEAAEQLRKAIALDPQRNRPYNLLGRTLSLQGNTAAAFKVFDESISRGSPANVLAGWVACAQVRAGRRDEALRVLQEELRAAPQPRRLAYIYSCMGDADHAIEQLERLLKAGDAGLPNVLQSPELSWLRSTPRLAVLRKQLNLTP
jgi:TolB-like protein/Tfp pilus assembly protein PilF